MSILIRTAEEKDIPFILELLDYIRSLHYHGRPDVFKDKGTKYTSEQLKEKLKDEKERIFVAYEGEKPLGYICTVCKGYKDHNIMKDKKTLYIDDLCVYSSYRNRGVGRMLMDAAHDYARSIGCQSLELVVWKFEGSAESFYRSYGFTTMSRRMELKIENDN